MPKIAELADYVLRLVADELEVTKEQILSKSRKAEIVDARWLAVMLMYKSGMYPMRIAESLRISPRYAHYIITGFSDRKDCNPILRMNYEAVKNKLGL